MPVPSSPYLYQEAGRPRRRPWRCGSRSRDLLAAHVRRRSSASVRRTRPPVHAGARRHRHSRNMPRGRGANAPHRRTPPPDASIPYPPRVFGCNSMQPEHQWSARPLSRRPVDHAPLPDCCHSTGFERRPNSWCPPDLDGSIRPSMMWCTCAVRSHAPSALNCSGVASCGAPAAPKLVQAAPAG